MVDIECQRSRGCHGSFSVKGWCGLVGFSVIGFSVFTGLSRPQAFSPIVCGFIGSRVESIVGKASSSWLFGVRGFTLIIHACAASMGASPVILVLLTFDSHALSATVSTVVLIVQRLVHFSFSNVGMLRFQLSECLMDFHAIHMAGSTLWMVFFFMIRGGVACEWLMI